MTQEENVLFDGFQAITELSKLMHEAGAVTFQECDKCHYVTFNHVSLNIQDKTFYFEGAIYLEQNNSSMYWAILGILLCYGFTDIG